MELLAQRISSSDFATAFLIANPFNAILHETQKNSGILGHAVVTVPAKGQHFQSHLEFSGFAIYRKLTPEGY